MLAKTIMSLSVPLCGSILNERSAAVDADDTERAKEISGELLALANERNKACKTMK
jgi:hypothetical protein